MNASGKSEDAVTSLDRLLTVIQEDIRHVHVRITAAIAIAAVFVTQIPLHELRGQPSWARTLTVLGVLALAVAAALYFQYTQQLNKLRLRIVAENLPSEKELGDAAESWRSAIEDATWDYVPDRDLWLFRIGQGLLFFGSACVGVVLVRLIVK